MSKYGATLTVLCTTLSEAVLKDEAGEGCDISAGLFGAHLSEWLRDTAETVSGEKRQQAHTTTGIPLQCGVKGYLSPGVECGYAAVNTNRCGSPDKCEHQLITLVERTPPPPTDAEPSRPGDGIQ